MLVALRGATNNCGVFFVALAHVEPHLVLVSIVLAGRIHRIITRRLASRRIVPTGLVLEPLPKGNGYPLYITFSWG